jgi:hypothetical protein
MEIADDDLPFLTLKYRSQAGGVIHALIVRFKTAFPEFAQQKENIFLRIIYK